MNFSSSFNGWFGEIADDVTYDNIDLLVSKLYQYFQKNSTSGQKLVIGYDSRLFSKKFAEYIAVSMANYGIKIFISNKVVPSSVLVVSSVHKKSMGTICVTGDEHDANFVGFRVFNDSGFALNEDEMKHFDSKKKKKPQERFIRKWINKGFVEPFDPSIVYSNYIPKYINFEDMNPSFNRVLFNPMFGSGIYFFDRILKQHGIRGYSIDYEETSDLNKIEPLPSLHVEDLYTHMVYKGAELGFIVSPDCSTFEFMVGPHHLSKQEILFFILDNLSKKGKTGTVLLSSGLNYDDKLLSSLPVEISYIENEYFQEELRKKKHLIAIDDFSRFYFDDHGVADALMAGYYLLEALNNKSLTPAKLEHKINSVREMIG